MVDSDGGPLSDIFVVLDVVGLMRARVDITGIGCARGTAAALVACGTGERRASPHATFSLRCRDHETVAGNGGDLSRRAIELAAQRARLAAAVATATGRTASVVSEDLENDHEHDARRALALGIIDMIVEPRPRARP